MDCSTTFVPVHIIATLFCFLMPSFCFVFTGAFQVSGLLMFNLIKSDNDVTNATSSQYGTSAYVMWGCAVIFAVSAVLSSLPLLKHSVRMCRWKFVANQSSTRTASSSATTSTTTASELTILGASERIVEPIASVMNLKLNDGIGLYDIQIGSNSSNCTHDLNSSRPDTHNHHNRPSNSVGDQFNTNSSPDFRDGIFAVFPTITQASIISFHGQQLSREARSVSLPPQPLSSSETPPPYQQIDPYPLGSSLIFSTAPFLPTYDHVTSAARVSIRCSADGE